MKINEVEALVGITKKNIRFYEEQGLLKPGRNSQNGYREYGEPEVELLRQIKLLRKIMKLIQNPEALNQIREAGDVDEVYSIVNPQLF